MRAITRVLVLAAFLVAPLAFGETVFPGASWEYYESSEQAGFSQAKLDELTDFLRESTHATGVVVVVSGKVLYQFGDVEELSYLASARKSILAMLYGKYVENGTIDLEKTLAELHVDDNAGLLPSEKEATVLDLITARSGIYHPASNGGDDTEYAPVRGSRTHGTYYLYNNWDFNAAGAVFEMLTGMEIYDALERDLARPIGMEDFDREKQRKSGDLSRSRYPAYHMFLSTRDMARVGYLMLREGSWNGQQIVPKEWAKRIVSVVTPVSQMNPERRRSLDQGYGYMWWVWDGPNRKARYEGAYSARGAMGQYITVLPALDMVVAYKTKAAYRRSTSWEMYEGALERLLAAKLPR